MKKTTKTLIISILAVVVLVGAFLAVHFLVPTQTDSDADSESDSAVVPDHYHLVGHIPAEIKQIEVENETGKYTLLSETPTYESDNEDGTTSTYTDATVYTLVGYEDMELLTGSPDTLANDAASVTATKIVNDGSAKSDFGFDNPRAVVKVTYTSGEAVTIRVGDDAPDSQGAYLMIDGDENVYLVDSDSVDGFLIGAMGMLTTEIGFAAQDDSGNVFTKMVFGGSIFDGEEVVLDYSDKEAFSESYVITSPDQTIANEETVTYMVNTVRNLTAEEVVAVNVDDDKIKEYGLDDPYVTVEAEYPDLSVNYKASKPDEENKLYLLSDGIIYKMDATAIPWANYTYDQLIPSAVMSPSYSKVNKVTVEAEGKKYEFELTRTTETSHDEDNDTDVESTTTTVKCNGKDVSEASFSAFYQNLTSAQRSGIEDAPGDIKSVLKVTYEFSDGTTGTAEYFEGENRKCPVLINGTLGSTAFESYVTKILSDVKTAANGEIVESVY